MEYSSLKDKNVLVTGGTGSVGSLLVEAAVQAGARTVRVLDMDETKEFNMAHRLRKRYDNIRFLLGDVRDRERMRRAMENVDVVFHCAALKHVYSSEYNPFETVKTNILGTQNVVDAALDEEVEKVILTSSDKAVNPCNVMGATKLLAERLVTGANFYKGRRRTVLASVRFGNVLGSRGSVVPLFRRQIKRGGPVTITDPAMTRFVMTPAQTVQLIFKATEIAQGGEIFVLKMPALKVGDLAHAMVTHYAARFGLDPKKIAIQTIGALAGEKMHEELMTGDESRHALETEDLFIILPEVEKDIGPPVDQKKYHARPARIEHFYSGGGTLLDGDGILRMLE